MILNLQDRVAYTTFINRLLPGRFKFSLTESKVTTLADVLKKKHKILSRRQRYAQVTSLNSKRIGRGWDNIETLSQISTQRKMRREVGVSTQAPAISLWKSREAQCSDDPNVLKLRPTSGTRTSIVNTMRAQNV